jgi:hypothetical protein
MHLAVVFEPGIERGHDRRCVGSGAELRPAPASLYLLRGFVCATPSVSVTAFSGTVRIGRRPAQQRFFCPRGGERLSHQDLELEDFAAEQALELADPLHELAHSGSADHYVVSPDCFPAASAIRCVHLNSTLGEMPCLRATNETDMRARASPRPG